jgi:hypothetical protein
MSKKSISVLLVERLFLGVLKLDSIIDPISNSLFLSPSIYKRHIPEDSSLHSHR